MKAVILAAGKGTRLAPLTDDLPKVLVPINGKPFLQYVIEHLNCAGFIDLAIVIGYRGDQVRAFVDSLGLSVTFIEQKEQKGTAHAVSLAKGFVGNEDFVVVAGDNIWSSSDLERLNVSDSDSYSYVSATKVSDPSRFGVLVVEDGLLVKVVEKPKEFVSDLVNVSAYKFTSEIFDALSRITVSSRGELEITDALSLLALEKKVKVNVLDGFWHDLGCVEDILILSEILG